MNWLYYIVEHEIKMQTSYELRHPQVTVHAYIGRVKWEHSLKTLLKTLQSNYGAYLVN